MISIIIVIINIIFLLAKGLVRSRLTLSHS